ncbi:MAG: YXWGXW repeat-containing protein [Polyangiaceae bacterium]
MDRVGALLAVALLGTGCVVGAERRPTTDANRASPPVPDEERTAGDSLVGGPREPEAETPSVRPHPDAVWVDGSWRWDGVRYVWQPGRWERAHPSWLRREP